MERRGGERVKGVMMDREEARRAGGGVGWVGWTDDRYTLLCSTGLGSTDLSYDSFEFICIEQWFCIQLTSFP